LLQDGALEDGLGFSGLDEGVDALLVDALTCDRVDAALDDLAVLLVDAVVGFWGLVFFSGGGGLRESRV
jgi:hypothetical protein